MASSIKQVSMKCINMILLLLLLLFTSTRGQQLHGDVNRLLMKDIIDTLDTLSLQLKAQSAKVKSLFEAQEVKMEAKLEGLQQCSTRDQVSELQDLLAIDECKEHRHNCSQMAECVDHRIDYSCTCLPGYSGDGFTCEDVDECSENIDTCSGSEVCSNTPGSFTCNCSKYLKKVRGICRVPVCKSPSFWIPSLGCLKAVVEFMNWDAAKSKCQNLGMRLAEGIHRRHMESLVQHLRPIIGGNWPWVGLRNGRWLTSGEEEVSGEDWRGEGEPHGGDHICGEVDAHSPINIGLADDPCSVDRLVLCQSLP